MSSNDIEETAVSEVETLGPDDAAAGPRAEGADDEPPIYDRREGGSANRHKRAIFGVPVEVVIAVGRANPSIGELLSLRRDALLSLNAKVDDPVDVMVGKRVIARGELQELDDDEGRLGVRLTEIVDLSEPF